MESEEGLHASAIKNADGQEDTRPDCGRDRDRDSKERVGDPEHAGSHRDGYSKAWDMASEDDREDSVA